MRGYYVVVQFEDLEQVEYYVRGESAQDCVDIIRSRFQGTPCDVVRVSMVDANWH